ncbi:unnamed protein product [Calypogeia fissa]
MFCSFRLFTLPIVGCLSLSGAALDTPAPPWIGLYLGSPTLKLSPPSNYVTWEISALEGWRVVPGAEDAYQDIRCVKAFNVVGKPDGSHKVVLVDKESLSNFSHVVAAATSFGKNVLLCAAAQLDKAVISDVVKVLVDKTFIRLQLVIK